jgi:hypothetical protein
MKQTLPIITLLFSTNIYASAPIAPENLEFTNITAHSVTLNWEDKSDDESGFKIFRDGKLITTTPANTTTYLDAGLLANSNYKYEIKATKPDNQESSVFKTGESRSVNEFDDGSYQKGVQRSYTKSDNIITDNVTKLQWQDSSLKSTNWDSAIQSCENLNLSGFNDWRLPNMNELLTLLDFGYSPKIDPTFSTKRAGSFWSLDTYEADPQAYAYYVNFSNGSTAEYNDRSKFKKTNKYYIRCVRGEDQRAASHFSRDESTKIVTDIGTNLMWEDNPNTFRTKNWTDSISYCENLTLGGYDNWRLPNINELYTTTDQTKFDPALNEIFKSYKTYGNNEKHYAEGNFWSSSYHSDRTVDGNTFHYIRTLNMQNGTSHRCREYFGMYVRCVRDID